jgi:CMP-N-acetylneuraminic acid synthetase
LTDPKRNVLAIIPARAGSKRLPGKNVTGFLGKPMIVHTIEAALESNVFAQIVVSSDDRQILDLCRSYDVEAMHRPHTLSSDEARVVDVCLDVLDRLSDTGREFPVFACLYATAPLRSAGDIAATVVLIEPGVCDFAMAVTGYAVPPHQALKRSGAGTLAPMWPDLVDQRDEDIGDLVVDNGSTYAADTAAFRARRSFYGPGLRGHVMPRLRSIDINTQDDLTMAELAAERLDA